MDDALALLIVGIAMTYLMKAIWRTIAGTKSTGCGCGTPCSEKFGNQDSNAPDLVSIESIQPLHHSDGR